MHYMNFLHLLFSPTNAVNVTQLHSAPTDLSYFASSPPNFLISFHVPFITYSLISPPLKFLPSRPNYNSCILHWFPLNVLNVPEAPFFLRLKASWLYFFFCWGYSAVPVILSPPACLTHPLSFDLVLPTVHKQISPNIFFLFPHSWTVWC